MKITIDGNVYINGMSDKRTEEITIGKDGQGFVFIFDVEDKKIRVRLSRSDLQKVLEILEQGLM